MSDYAFNGENVIAVSFEDDSTAHEALTLIMDLTSQGQIDLQGARLSILGAIASVHADGF